jgi:hypothetical protein
MLQNLRRQSVNITTFKEQQSQKEEQKTVKPCGMSKEDLKKIMHYNSENVNRLLNRKSFASSTK